MFRLRKVVKYLLVLPKIIKLLSHSLIPVEQTRYEKQEINK